MAKDIDYRRMIHTSRWIKLRKNKLRKQPLCEECLKDGYIVVAHEVHHITPVEEALTLRQKESLMFNPSNLMSLCHNCHVKIHTALGRSGRDASKERSSLKLAAFESRFFLK